MPRPSMNLCVADNAVEPPGPYERERLFSALVSEAASRAAKGFDSSDDAGHPLNMQCGKSTFQPRPAATIKLTHYLEMA
jgi:hypothetical protein